jgi:hypothetical protein
VQHADGSVRTENKAGYEDSSCDILTVIQNTVRRSAS